MRYQLALVLSLFALPAYAGIEEATAKGATRAEACKAATVSAEATARRTTFVGPGRKFVVTEKKCECEKIPESDLSYNQFMPWSCLAYVNFDVIDY